MFDDGLLVLFYTARNLLGGACVVATQTSAGKMF
mgnify:CR=1 FL=1